MWCSSQEGLTRLSLISPTRLPRALAARALAPSTTASGSAWRRTSRRLLHPPHVLGEDLGVIKNSAAPRVEVRHESERRRPTLRRALAAQRRRRRPRRRLAARAAAGGGPTTSLAPRTPRRGQPPRQLDVGGGDGDAAPALPQPERVADANVVTVCTSPLSVQTANFPSGHALIAVVEHDRRHPLRRRPFRPRGHTVPAETAQSGRRRGRCCRRSGRRRARWIWRWVRREATARTMTCGRARSVMERVQQLLCAVRGSSQHRSAVDFTPAPRSHRRARTLRTRPLARTDARAPHRLDRTGRAHHQEFRQARSAPASRRSSSSSPW